MLRVGLTGGIGSGKSTAALLLAQQGAVVVDADVIARDVVARGTAGLAALADRFGGGVLTSDGDLDRAELARVVFGDETARADLERITHPLIADRARRIIAAVPPDRVVVHDVPLLVEKGMGDRYHLVVVVDAPVDVRVARLVGRGLPAADARARIDAQASTTARRAAADVWLDNSGHPDDLARQVGRLWDHRLAPYDANLRAGRPARSPQVPTVVPYDATWPAQAARLAARLTRALGAGCLRVDHIGSTAVPGMTAEDVIELQVGVARLSDGDASRFAEAMAAAGFPRMPGRERVDDRVHGGCDPERAVQVEVRVVGSPAWRAALLVRDWLRAVPEEAPTYRRGTEAGLLRATRWADRSGWSPGGAG